MLNYAKVSMGLSFFAVQMCLDFRGEVFVILSR